MGSTTVDSEQFDLVGVLPKPKGNILFVLARD
jgi:hypothetical protein